MEMWENRPERVVERQGEPRRWRCGPHPPSSTTDPARRRFPMSIRGLALYAAFNEYPATRNAQRERCCSDDVEISRVVERKPVGTRARKLASAVAAATSVFVKLLRRPVGGTTVVLVPRERVPDA